MKLFLWRIYLFLSYLGMDFYGERVGVGFAWELAKAVAPFADELMNEWERLEDWEARS